MLAELESAHALELAKQTEEAARARLAVLLSSAPAVIYCRRASGDYEPTFVSDSITRLFGVTPQDYLANPYLWRDRVHPDDIARINAWVDRMFVRDDHTIEYRVRRDDGSYGWVNDEQRIIRDDQGEPVEIVGSWTDITARKEAEADSSAARSQLTLLLGAAPSVIYSFAASGDFAPTFVSDNIHSLFGYGSDEYLKNADFWRGHVHPDDLETIEDRAGAAVRDRSAFRRIPVPQEGRHLLLGQRRAASHSRSERRAARSCRVVEQYRRPQGRGAGSARRASRAGKGDRSGARGQRGQERVPRQYEP